MRLTWDKGLNGGESYVWEDDNGLAIIHVVKMDLGPKVSEQWRNGMYEIIFNLAYVSRDKKAFFTTAEKAMEAAEFLLKRFCEKWQGVLNDSNT